MIRGIAVRRRIEIAVLVAAAVATVLLVAAHDSGRGATGPTTHPTASGPSPLADRSPSPGETAHPGRTFYLSPSGSDAADGSITSPWRTILGASKHLGPGDTLLVRGGTYHDPGGYDWARSASGTATEPITVMAYPGETPTFDGGATQPASGADSNPQVALIIDGIAHVIFDGLSFTDFDPYDNGLFLVVNSDHIAFQRIRGYQQFSSGDTEHYFYISHSSDITISDANLDGISGAAIHVFSSDYVVGSGAVGSRHIVVEGSRLTNNGTWGILAGSGLDNATFSGNTITSRQIGIQFDSPTSAVTVTQNSITAPVGIFTDLDDYGGYGPEVETNDCIDAGVQFKVGWPGQSWSLADWQATGRGGGTMVGPCPT